MSEVLATEKSLLFALLAFQNGFIQREQLLTAFSLWMADKSRPLEVILQEQSAISMADSAIIGQLVERHIQQAMVMGDAAESVVGYVHTVREALLKQADCDEELSQAFQTLSADETVAFPAPASGMAEVAVSYNQFRLIKEHASGGLGRVFVAEDLKFRRDVALKQIRVEYAHQPDYRAKFLLEAEVTGQLEHPGIVPVYAMGEDELGQPFYAMRFIKGEDLKSRIKQLHRQCPLGQVRLQGPGLRQLLRHFIDACHAVNYAHDRGVLHRDLKPSNIMLGKHGETLVVDWGLAKPLGVKLNHRPDETHVPNTELPLGTSDTASGSETRYGSFVGTAAYAPPEQVLGSLEKLGPTSDVYSLGAILYELLAGQAPLVGKDLERLIRQVTCGEIVPVSDVRPDAPLALVAVCSKAMSLAQEDRYPSVAELRRDVQRWLDDLPVLAYQEPLRQRTSRWLRRHPKWVAALASAVVIGALGIGIGSLLIEQKNIVLQKQNLVLEAAQREANQRRLDAEAALYDSLVSQSQLLVRQAGYPGWSWEAEQKLEQASLILPIQADQHRLRTLLLASAHTLDFRSVAKLVDGIDCQALCFSPNGRYLAIGQRKHNLASSVFVFETQSWELVQKYSVSAADGGLVGLGEAAARLFTGDRYQEGVLALTFSPDGRWLAAGTRLGHIHTWRADNNFQTDSDPQHPAPHQIAWHAFDGGVAELVFAPSGDSLWASSDRHGNYRCRGWNWQDNTWTAVEESLVDSSTALNTNGQGLLVSLTEGQLKWFDSRELRELNLASLPSGQADAVAVSSVSNQVAYATPGSITLCDLETGRRTPLGDITPESLTGPVELNFDASGELLAITADAPQVTVVAAVNGRRAKRIIPVPGRDQPVASFSQQGGLLAVTTERGVEVYQRRAPVSAVRQVVLRGCDRVDDVALDRETIWAIGQATSTAPPLYQLRQFQLGQSQIISISSLFCTDASQLDQAKFMSTQPLRVHLPGTAVLLRNSTNQRLGIQAAVSKSQLMEPEQAQSQLVVPFESQVLAGQVCLNRPADLVTDELGAVAELQASDSAQTAFGITRDGEGVWCLSLTDFSVLGKWSSQLETNLTGNARPLSLDVTGERAVIGGSDGIVHVVQTNGRVIGRGQLSQSALLALDTHGQHVIAGAFNGDAIVASLDRLNQPLVWHAHNAPLTAVAVLPAGDMFVSGSKAGEVTLWRRQADAIQPLVSFPVAPGSIQRLRLDDTGQRLAILVDDSNVAQVWDLVRLREYFSEYGVTW